MPTWVKEDHIMMENFKDMTGKLDTALGEHNTLLKRGDCSIQRISYTGSGVFGSSNPTSVSFGGVPLLVVVMDNTSGSSLVAIYGVSQGYVRGNAGISVVLSWSGSSLPWYSTSVENQLNVYDRSYTAVGLISK